MVTFTSNGNTLPVNNPTKNDGGNNSVVNRSRSIIIYLTQMWVTKLIVNER